MSDILSPQSFGDGRKITEICLRNELVFSMPCWCSKGKRAMKIKYKVIFKIGNEEMEKIINFYACWIPFMSFSCFFCLFVSEIQIDYALHCISLYFAL